MSPATQSFWPVVAALVIGLLLGALLAHLASRARSAAQAEQLYFSEQERQRLEPLAAEHEHLRIELAEERARRQADRERLAWIHTADEQLRSSFRDLASRALDRSTREQQSRLTQAVTPLEKALDGIDSQVRELEKERQGAYEGLRRELQLVRETQRELHGVTRDLQQAMQTSSVRGKWGEVQLRRLVEMAGMVAHVDFEEQPTASTGSRPDMIVYLPGDALIPVDAKSPMNAYLQAVGESSPQLRKQLGNKHLAAVKQRTIELGSKEYWRQFAGSPDFVVMFLPHEGSLSLAFEHDAELLEFCMDRKVLPATPVTLLALLKSIAWGWRQDRVANEAGRIAEAGRELHARLNKFVAHLAKTGQGLDAAVDAYNLALGSFDRRLMPAARRLEEKASANDRLTSPRKIDVSPRIPPISEGNDL